MDIERLNPLILKLEELTEDNKGSAFISGDFRLKTSSDDYINTLIQCYLFFTEVPYKTVFILQVVTDISWFKKDKHGYHFYVGKDPSYFRYPDEKLLLTGNVFSAR
jgi:hypothetical protein